MNSEQNRLTKVVQQLDGQDLSSIPSVLARILAVSRNPKSNAADLAAVCEMDKASSARLLRAANSVYYATESRFRVDSIKDAIVRIGFRTAEELIISSKVSSVLKTDTAIDDYSSSSLWKHSVAVGIASRLVHTRVYGAGKIDPFIAGLLHDIGIAIEHQFLFNEGFKDAVVRRHEKQSLLAAEETAVMGVNHEELGLIVAQKWNFPDHLAAVIGHHHSLGVDNEEHMKMIHVVRLAEYLCFSRDLGYSDFSQPHAEILRESRNVLGLDDEVLGRMADELAKSVTALVNLWWFSEMRLRRSL